jgi:hypothetical protein
MKQPATLEPKTIADLMEVTGLGRDTVRAAIRTGSLPGYYVTHDGSGRGQYVIPHQAFEDFCKGIWVPSHRPVFTENIRPLPQPEPAPQPDDYIKRRTG